MVEQDQCWCDVVESRQHDPVAPRCSLRLLAGFRQVKVKEMCAGKGLHVLAGMCRRTCGHCGGCHVPCCTLHTQCVVTFVCSVCVCVLVCVGDGDYKDADGFGRTFLVHGDRMTEHICMSKHGSITRGREEEDGMIQITAFPSPSLSPPHHQTNRRTLPPLSLPPSLPCHYAFPLAQHAKATDRWAANRPARVHHEVL